MRAPSSSARRESSFAAISGAGKSSLALGLIAAAERAGRFARLVGDDRDRASPPRRPSHRARPSAGRRHDGAARPGHPPHALRARRCGPLGRGYSGPCGGDALSRGGPGRRHLCGVFLPLVSLLKDAAAYDFGPPRLGQPSAVCDNLTHAIVISLAQFRRNAQNGRPSGPRAKTDPGFASAIGFFTHMREIWGRRRRRRQRRNGANVMCVNADCHGVAE